MVIFSLGINFLVFQLLFKSGFEAGHGFLSRFEANHTFEEVRKEKKIAQ